MLKEIIPAPLLRSLFVYCPTSGTLRWKKRNQNIAGTRDTTGHLRVEIKGRTYGAHRVCWAIFYGEWPAGWIDHKNRQKTDNRIQNLRLATRSQNGMNSSRGGKQKGVSFNKRAGRFVAKITSEGKRFFLGYFDDPREAAKAYDEAAIALHGQFAHTNREMAEEGNGR